MFENEIRLVPKPNKSQARISVAWCFPHTYSIGMSGLGFQLIYNLLDNHEDVAVNRVFTDVQECPPSGCDLFGFTVSWELDFINVLSVLERNSIPGLSKDRSDSDPIVFGGGPVLSANPEPFAEIFDIVLLGDAEETIPRLIDAVRLMTGTRSRSEKLKLLSECEGVYVPSLYTVEYEEGGALRSVTPIGSAPERVRKLFFRAPDDYVAHSIILSSDTTWGDTFLVEIARSCPQECRFCLASYLTRPFRTTPVNTVLAKVDMAREFTGKVGLMGPSITEHPEFDLILDGLTEREGLQVSVASVRADTLSTELVKKLGRLGQKSVTIALESGSERLRRIMKKNLTQDEIFSAVNAIECGGMTGVKFYGIAGLPYENDNDIEETILLLTRLKKEHKRLKMVFGLSSFVPKAQTPFQWMGRDPECKRKMEYLRKHLAKIGIDVRPESHNWSDIQALLSRGDRRLTPVLLQVARAKESLGSWKKALRDHRDRVPSLEFYAYRDIIEDEVLPWAHIANEEKIAFLSRHLTEARQEAIR